MTMEILTLPVAELTARYRSKALSPVEVTEAHLERAELVDAQLAAFQLLTPDLAREQARASEARWRAGTPIGELDGVPVTIKDNFDIAGLPTRSGSLTTSDKPATDDMPSVARLREAGAVFIGKTTTPEFAWKGITDSALRGITRNPWNPAHSPGGSSGGGAAALAAGVGALALGNDGGGSIRIPASLSGLFGIKPTFGRVPHAQTGLFCTLASGGPIARSVADAAAMLQVLVQPDDRDYYAVPAPAPDWLGNLRAGIKGMRIGYSPALQGIEPSTEVSRAIAKAIELARELGAEIEDVGPVLEPLRPIFEEHWRAGFGARLRDVPRDQWDLLDPGFRELAESGLNVSGEALNRAEIARAKLAEKMAVFHRRYPILLTATTPVTAPRADILYNGPDYDRWQVAVPYTVPFNLTGQPAASLPCGLSASGLPIGLQVIGPRFAEGLVMRVSQALESAIGFDTRPPQR
ncbi:amidase [Microvirga brassicacearum]|uniref:Indoleacetamide hydrolase n=1 Tax=Microvirga brassicacearum TaxID=2580413 RepID=A0A5N3PFC6_9HYPH|nr:amidase [Microvirga brassicacearum]KAB0268419.1 amidase [Microvirga brassicacearum]